MNHKKSFLALSLLFFIVLGRGAPQTQAGSEGISDIAAKVAAYAKPYLEMKVFSGSILIAQQGKIVLKEGYGMANYELSVPNTPLTKFHIASISKTFTAAAVLILQQRGLLRVDDALTKYIPDYPGGEKITLHHLLVHTSGIPNINNFPEYGDWSHFPQTPGSLIEKFKNRPLNFPPGNRYDYSNSNYNILAAIIEKISGRPYGVFLKENIFDPLEMRDTAHDGDPAILVPNVASGYAPAGYDGFDKTPCLDWTIKTGNGSIYSTVEDLYKWDRALTTERILSSESKSQAFRPHVDGSVGYGWFISRRLNRRCIRMSGRSPGFQGEIHRYVDDGSCVIVLGNNYSGAASFMINDIAAIAFGEPYETLAVDRELKVDPGVMESYLGLYQGGGDFFVPNASLTLEKREGRLTLRWSMGGLSWLVPVADSRFYDRNYGGLLTFGRDDGGKVSYLVYRSSGRDYRAEKKK